MPCPRIALADTEFSDKPDCRPEPARSPFASINCAHVWRHRLQMQSGPSSEPAREQRFARLPRLPFLCGDKVPSSGGSDAWLLTAALSRMTTYSLDFANHPFILELKGENYGTSYFIITGNSLHQTARGIGAEREVQKQYLRGDQEGRVPGAGEIVDPLVRMDTQRDRGVGGIAREGKPCRKKMRL
jgi:hypothetical protein